MIGMFKKTNMKNITVLILKHFMPINKLKNVIAILQFVLFSQNLIHSILILYPFTHTHWLNLVAANIVQL